MLKPFNKAEVSFDFLKEIGATGQNSRTYLSKDHQLDAEIAIKQIEKKKLNSTTEFFEESKSLYASAHPNVVQIHYACQDAENVYIAMPFYQNGSVKDLMAKRNMTVREIVRVSCQILSGLHNIHSKNLIHFDIKPDNILLTDRREAIVADFGLAKQMNYSGIAFQDRHYSKMTPPEAMVTDHLDLRFDIFQMGLTLYRMCNGDQCFYDQFTKYGPVAHFDRASFRFDVKSGKFPDRKIFKAHIPSRLRTLVRKCLQVDRASRFQSALDVANGLALIDQTLDWRMSESPDKTQWTRNEEGTKIVFTAFNDGKTECTKTVGAGSPRKVTEGCMKSATPKDIERFLGSYDP